jgi:hypothetical protein
MLAHDLGEAMGHLESNIQYLLDEFKKNTGVIDLVCEIRIVPYIACKHIKLIARISK